MQIESPQAIKRPRTSRPFLVGAATLLAITSFYYAVLEPQARDARTASRTARELDYVRRADYALIDYMSEHDGRFPQLSGDMVSTLRPYIKDPKVLDAMKYFVWNDKLSGKRAEDLDHPNQIVVLYSVVPLTDSIAIGTAGGITFRMPTEYLPQLIAKANSLQRVPTP